MSYDLMVAHCPVCEKVYQKNLRNMCSDCSAEEDRHLRSIELELKRNRRLDNEELSALTGIPVKRIRTLIRQGKLKLYDYPNLADACDLCAAPVRQGKLCASCSTRIQSDIHREFERAAQMQERLRAANSYFNKR